MTQILEFQPGETQKNITIIINNDQRIEAAEQFELYLAGGIGVHLSPFSRTAITITNDDGKATEVLQQQNYINTVAIIFSYVYHVHP